MTGFDYAVTASLSRTSDVASLMPLHYTKITLAFSSSSILQKLHYLVSYSSIFLSQAPLNHSIFNVFVSHITHTSLFSTSVSYTNHINLLLH